mgnify:CR=1 FL=1
MLRRRQTQPTHGSREREIQGQDEICSGSGYWFLVNDREELLKAFGGEEATSPIKAGSAPGTASTSKKLELTLAVERKGRGGKTVTIVRGLKGLDTAALMAINAEIKTALGIGARFTDAVLELQGDQRQRAAAWFENKNFSCRIL